MFTLVVISWFDAFLGHLVTQEAPWLYWIYCAFHKHANSEVQKLACVAGAWSQRLLRRLFKSQLTIAFFAAVNHLNGPLRKQNFTLTGSKGQGL